MNDWDDLAEMVEAPAREHRSALLIRSGRKHARGVYEHRLARSLSIASQQGKSAATRKIKPVVSLAKVNLPD